MKKLKVCMLITCLIMCFSSITLAANFYDIKGTKYEGVVDRVARLGIINGVSDKAFAPNKSITRAELAKMIVYTKGLQKYADTSGIKSNFKDTKGHWAESYIATAADLELLKGYGDGTFKPDKEVSYAEVVAIVLRGLGYVNIDETEGSAWYSGYIKRMFEIELEEGIEEYKSYESPAKRGDVAILWWNMLVSDRWVVKSESDGSGLYYTYSPKPQLEVLFPDFYAINGKISSISNGTSGDTISILVNGKWRETDSEVPIYALGATATAVYDVKADRVYGLSIDERLEEHKVVSGPIFHLKNLGYNLSKIKVEATYGERSDATYAYLLVSKNTNEILRAVFVDASESVYVEEITVKADEENKDKDKDESVIEFARIYLNGSEDAYTTNDAVVIKNGKKVEWETLESEIILTELIPNMLYTYEDKKLEGNITNYKNLDELYVDNDKYLVAENCSFVIFGEKAEDEKNKDALKVYDYSRKMDTKKLESLLSRNAMFYLNAAEEISFIYFGKYRPSNIMEKYDEGAYRIFYVTSIGYKSGDDTMLVGGENLAGKQLKFYLDYNENEEYKIGDLISLTEIEGKTAAKVEVLTSDVMYEDEDIAFIYDYDQEYYRHSFGEYMMMEDTLIYRVDKYYSENSNGKIDEYRITRLNTIDQLGELSKYKINLLCNNEMEIDIVYAEREINKTRYPVGQVISIEKIQSPELDPEDADFIPLVKVRINTIGSGTKLYKMLSGDCAMGELITYQASEEGEDTIIKIKERFKTRFLGYEKDMVVASVDKETGIITMANAPEKLDLDEVFYTFNGKEYDLLDYKFLMTVVSKDTETGEWKFTNCKFYTKEELKLKPGDRIAFGELNGIAVVYRGWQE